MPTRVAVFTKRDESLAQGHASSALYKYHIFYNEPSVCRCEAGDYAVCGAESTYGLQVEPFAILDSASVFDWNCGS